MAQGKRRPWLDEDNAALISCWDSVGSVALIAIMLKRSRSSVQTQASRKGLPPRAEESDRHRRRWAEGDDERMDAVLEEISNPDGTIPIQVLAERMGRSVDAVVARIEARHGEDSDIMDRLVAPPMPELPPQGVMPKLKERASDANIKDPRKKRETKKCLRCREVFVSAGAHNWICISCKRLDEWDSD